MIPTNAVQRLHVRESTSIILFTDGQVSVTGLIRYATCDEHYGELGVDLSREAVEAWDSQPISVADSVSVLW